MRRRQTKVRVNALDGGNLRPREGYDEAKQDGGQDRSQEYRQRWVPYTTITVHPQNVRFQNVWFQNVRFQNVRFTKRSKRLVSKRPVFKFDILMKQKV
jgi:hypothetical protein